MHAVRLLQTNIEKSCPNIHKKRTGCLFEVVGSLIDCGKLWISALGSECHSGQILPFAYQCSFGEF
ncbi:TPA: hypothetical protein ACGCO1_002972 [Legionella pneumophila]